MFRELEEPEVVAIPGGQITLTHARTQFLIVPGSETPVQLRVQKGFIHEGVFHDYGAYDSEVLDKQDFEDLMDSKDSPKGDFTLGEVLRKVATKKEENV